MGVAELVELSTGKVSEPSPIKLQYRMRVEWD